MHAPYSMVNVVSLAQCNGRGRSKRHKEPYIRALKGPYRFPGWEPIEMLWISPLKLIGFRGQLAVPKPGVPPPFPYIQGSLVKMQKTTRINHPPDREFGGQFLAFFAQKSRKSLILTKNSSDRAIGFWVRANWNWFKKVQKIAQKRAIFSFFCRICKIPRPPPGKSEKTPKTHDNCPIKKSHFFGKNTKKVTFWGFFGKFMKIHHF